MYGPSLGARETRITLSTGLAITVDEVKLEARTPYGTLHVGDAHDTLGLDLRAWVDGTHRGTPVIGIRAQTLVA
jgi:hypothetical protein